MNVKLLFGSMSVSGLLALGAFGLDYANQMSKAGDGYDLKRYAAGFYHRAADTPGAAFLDKSAYLSAAIPSAPNGWTKHRWNIEWEKRLYSYHQIQAVDQEANKALGRTWLASVDDLKAHVRFVDASSAYYSLEEQALMLNVFDYDVLPDLPNAHADFQTLEQHFDQTHSSEIYATFNDVTWHERKGPITRARQGHLPFQLRIFETWLGDANVAVYARANDAAIHDFLQSLDLSAARALGENDHAPLTIAALGAAAKAAIAPTKIDIKAIVEASAPPPPPPAIDNSTMPQSRIRVNRIRNSGCSSGTFCKSGS